MQETLASRAIMYDIILKLKKNFQEMTVNKILKYLICLWLVFVAGFAINYAVNSYYASKQQVAVVGIDQPIENKESVDAQSAKSAQPEKPNEIIVTVGKGDTIARILSNSGIDSTQSHTLIKALNKKFSMKSLRVGLELVITVDNSEGYKKLTKLQFQPTFNHVYIATLGSDDDFKVEVREIELLHEVKWAVGTVEGSIYQSAVTNGVPSKIIRDMIAAFSHDIDFQHGLKENDKFALMYEVSTDPETDEQRPGNLLFAELLVSGKSYQIIRYKSKGGTYEYYNQQGESVKKGLLKTPIDGARLNSRFGNRTHPTLGYTKFHKGVDFSAPQGTPIMASGDGVITKIGPWGAYGNYIQIRHNGEYSTAYAHLKNYAPGMKTGRRVKQGEVIGRVGLTGRTTGAHLHYEVLKHNRHINPMSVKMVSSNKLPKRDLMEFNKAKGSIAQHYSVLGKGQKFNLAEVSTFLSATVNFKNIAVSDNANGEKKLG